MWLCGLQRTSRGSYKETNEQTRLHESGGIPNMLLCLRLQDTQQCGLANASSSRKLLLLTAPEPVRTEKARRFNKLKRLKKKKSQMPRKRWKGTRISLRADQDSRSGIGSGAGGKIPLGNSAFSIAASHFSNSSWVARLTQLPKNGRSLVLFMSP